MTRKRVSVMLDDEHREFLKTKDDASAFIRSLLDEAMKAAGVKQVEVEEKKREELEMTSDELEIFSDMLNVAKQTGWEFYGDDYKMLGYPLDEGLLQILLGDCLVRLQNKRSVNTAKLVEENKEDMNWIKQLRRKFEAKWNEIYHVPEKFLEEIIPHWTLQRLMRELGDPSRVVLSTQKVAGLLGMSYQKVYNKIRPILEKYGYRFKTK